MVIFKTMNDLPTQFRQLFSEYRTFLRKNPPGNNTPGIAPRRKTPTGTNSLA